MSADKVISIGSKSRKKQEDKKNGIKDEAKNASFEPIYCSFCGRPNTQVPKMVKGPGVNICSECTLIAVQYLILQDGLISAEADKILSLFWGAPKNDR